MHGRGFFLNVTDQSIASCGRKTHSGTKILLKEFAVFKGFLYKDLCNIHKNLCITAFTSET